MPQFDNRDEWEARIKRDLLRLTEPQAARLLRLLGDPPDVSRVPDSFWHELGNDLAATLKPSLQAIYVESARQVLPTIPRALRVDWHLVNAPAATWAEQYTFNLVKGINATSQEKLQTYVSNFFKVEGTTVGDLRASIEPMFGEARAGTITTTEITRAAAQGEIGIVNEIEGANPKIAMVPIWDTSMDEWVCPLCGRKGLQGIEGKMVGGQPRYKSRNGQTYGPPPDPHPGCRCGERWEPRPRGRR